jgi:hypothetical protein
MVHEVSYNTKYKTIDKKIQLAAVLLPLDAAELLQRTQQEPRLLRVEDIGHIFTKKTLE